MLHLEEGLADGGSWVKARASVVVERDEAPEDQGHDHANVDAILSWACVWPFEHQDDQDEDKGAESLRPECLEFLIVTC